MDCKVLVQEAQTMAREDVEALRRQNPIEAVVGRYVALRRSGRTLRGRCPFHDDHHPSFHVYPDTQSFYCFGCGAHGDVFTFVMRIENVDFRGALQRLSEVETHLPPPPASSVLRVQPATPELSDEHYAVLTAAARFYHQRFMALDRPRQAVQRRAVSDEVARRCWVGYASGRGLRTVLRQEGLNLHLAQEIGLLTPRGEHLAGRIVVPELRQGRALFLIGRATRRDQEPKYLGLPIPKPLYGLAAIQDSDEAWVTEGVFDWLTLLSWGYPAVALLGTWLKRELLHHFDPVRRIYLILDTDDEGRAAMLRLQALFGQRAQAVYLPAQVKDVNDLARQPAGRETFAWLAEMARASACLAA
jgi:DNA primase